jgi:hypothetical protein
MILDDREWDAHGLNVLHVAGSGDEADVENLAEQIQLLIARKDVSNQHDIQTIASKPSQLT